MSEVVTKLFNVLNRYEVMTQLVAGAFIGALLRICLRIDIPPSGSVDGVLLYWVMGIVSGRVGALIIEPSLRRLGRCSKWLGPIYVDRELYVKFKKADPEWFTTLLATANFYRTLAAGGVVVAFLRVLLMVENGNFAVSNRDILIVLWIVLFVASYWRQVSYLRINAEESTMNGEKG